MRKLLLFTAAFALSMSGPVAASPLCTTASDNKLSTLRAFTASTACQVGSFDLRFNNVGLSGTPGNSASTTQTTASAIEARTLVSFATVSPDQLTVTFDVLPGSLTLNGTNDLGVKSGGVQAEYTFNYSVTPLVRLYGIFQVRYDVTNLTAGAGGYAVGYKQIKDNGGNVVAQESFDNVVGPVIGLVNSTSGTDQFAITQGKVFIQDTLQFSNPAYMRSGTLKNTLDFTQVPEPLTMALAGAGLVGLGLLRRRTKKA